MLPEMSHPQISLVSRLMWLQSSGLYASVTPQLEDAARAQSEGEVANVTVISGECDIVTIVHCDIDIVNTSV
jgi:hypothetical protein